MVSSEVAFLTDLGLIAFLTLALSLIFIRLKLPIAIGHLIVGMLIGPYSFNLIQDLDIINLMASLGIILLLFVIGVEMDPNQLKRAGIKVLTLASIEIAVCMIAGMMVGLFLGLSWIEVLFLASILSISSTAIVVKMIPEVRELSEGDRRLIVGIMLMEDIFVVILLLLLHSLAIAGRVSLPDLAFLASKGLVLVSIIVSLSYTIIPKLIDFVRRYEKEAGEASLLLSLGLGFFFAIVATYLGYSPAIGAFTVGLMIRGEQSCFIFGKISPFMNLFMVIFFISMGALIDPKVLLSLSFPLILIVTVGITSKFIGGWLGARVCKMNGKEWIVGLTIVPRGEFSFVFAGIGLSLGVITLSMYSFIGIVVLVTSLFPPIFLALRKKLIKK
ncbi:MAG: cation:proton antiporter [archaeon]|nr:cation:proton antiporter [archaeon]MCP8321058.1 cation:proton antiporter [archaeon]